MRRESSTFSTILFSLLIILFTREIQARIFQRGCSSSCGDIKNIGYPFRLKGYPADCGDFELSCQSNKTILEFNSGKYYVERISYWERIIRVVDVDSANENCSLPNQSLPPCKIIHSGRHYLRVAEMEEYTNVCFVRCYKDIRNTTYRRVPCLSGNQSSVYAAYGASTAGDLPESCSFISMVPVRYGHEKSPSYETIRKLLDSRFDLRWSVEYSDPSVRTSFVGRFCGRNAYGFEICTNDESPYRKTLYFLKLIFQSFMESFLRAGFADYLYFYYDYIEDPSYVFGADIHERIYCMAYLFGVFVRFLSVFLIARFILSPIVLFVYVIHKYRTTWKIVDKVEKFLDNQQSWMPKRYSYPEIMAVTNNFKDKLGQGGFGSVYKGQLRTGCLIAVKVLENSKFSADDFISEVSTIGRIHHVNVVQLLGFCSEGSRRALVYKYMPNGSLDKYLFSKKGKGQSFGWEKLHEIALGIAYGIEYLHCGCDMCILHFDIKPHNILLDHNLIPKVADFGLAKFYPKENDFVSVSTTRGTIGYIAPELISRTFGTVSGKSDVYSFGMLLLEMAGGRRNSILKATRSSKAYFPPWVYDRISNGEDLELLNVTEIEGIIARKLCIIGLWCIQVKPADRPSMTRVIEMLEGNTDDLQMPPKPFFSSSHQNISVREVDSDSSTELLIAESLEECSYNNSNV